MTTLKAAILDVDGTLVDSNDAHAQAFIRAFAEFGFEPPYSAVRGLIGMGSDQLLPRAIGVSAASETGRRIVERKGEIFARDLLPALEPTPGARALLERLRAAGLQRVVATSADGADLESLLTAARVRDLVDLDTAVTRDDADRSKPAPDVVAAAIEKSGVPPERALMIGDTPYDIEAAARAGVDIVALRCGGWTDEDLAGAVAIYDDPADLVAQFPWSPFGLAR